MRTKMTEAKLRQFILEGRGQGYGPEYLPWLLISKGNIPSGGNAEFMPIPLLGRYGHFLSKNEWLVAIFLLWIGCIDLLEQFPMWPWNHPHPLSRMRQFIQTRNVTSSGTLALAERLQFKPVYHTGTKLPYIHTLDLLGIYQAGKQVRCIGVSCKPPYFADPERIDVCDLETLALERAWAQELDIPWQLAASKWLNKTLLDNLETAQHYAIWKDADVPITDTVGVDATLNERLQRGDAIQDCLDAVERRFKLPRCVSSNRLQHALWHRKVPIDPRHPLVMSLPARLTDFAWVKNAWDYLLGEERERA